MCFGYTKEPSHRDSSFEYPQHMFSLRNKNYDFPLNTLIWRPGINKNRVLLRINQIFNRTRAVWQSSSKNLDLIPKFNTFLVKALTISVDNLSYLASAHQPGEKYSEQFFIPQYFSN